MATEVHKLIQDYSELGRYPTAKHVATFKINEVNFVKKIDNLFGIFCEDDKRRNRSTRKRSVSFACAARTTIISITKRLART